ncbi:MAG TPA: hypothetical protein VKA84_16340 [Gemmatimonadaceae bacterium]|nr:hypothetical protein [Gemmatimonadaceae bacterium]
MALTHPTFALSALLGSPTLAAALTGHLFVRRAWRAYTDDGLTGLVVNWLVITGGASAAYALACVASGSGEPVAALLTLARVLGLPAAAATASILVNVSAATPPGEAPSGRAAVWCGLLSWVLAAPAGVPLVDLVR